MVVHSQINDNYGVLKVAEESFPEIYLEKNVPRRTSPTLREEFKLRVFENRILSRILYVVLYGCETWSLTLKEECRLRVFENRIIQTDDGSKPVRAL